jgi:hypothetical protein
MIIKEITVNLWTNQGETYVKIIGYDKEGNAKTLIKESNHGTWARDMLKMGAQGYYDLWAPRFIGMEATT